LTGKAALITGAGSGIGEATARLFAREGAKVALIGRRAELLDLVAREIVADGREALALPCDVSQETEVERAVASVVDAWGRLDTCVAVAGVEPWDRGDARVDRLDLAVWNQVIGINLTGMFLTSKHAIRAMLAGGGGSLIVTGSPTGLYGTALGQHAYSASKAGCHGLARVMANEYARDGIRVNCVIPGFIDTPLVAGVFHDAERLNRLYNRIPLRRAGRADEVAAMNLWLASDEASYACGGFFVVDGGQTAI
jgi:NAD(P)-dependent dehydrogenase (short-subunit alcohol dehydrogenase family)